MKYTIEVGAIKCRITPVLDSQTLSRLDDELSYKVEEAHFSNMPYDARVRLFNKKKQLFNVGLLNRVKLLFDHLEVGYLVQDYREYPDLNPTRFVVRANGVEFRPYQIRAQDNAIAEKCGVIELPTGGGKTYTIAGLIARIGATPTIFYVPKNELLYQTKEAYQKFFDAPIGILGDSQVDLQEITVATVQTVYAALKKAREIRIRDEKVQEFNRLSRKRQLTHAESVKLEELVQDQEKRSLDQRTITILEYLSQAQMFVMDECHHVPANSIQEICYFHKQANYRYGTSATPFREDGEDLKIEGALGHKVIQVTPKELIDQGYLVPPKIFLYRVLPSVKTSDLAKITFPAIYKANIVEHDSRNDKVLKCALKFEEWDLTTMVLVNHIAHGQELLRTFRDAGLHCHFIKGEMNNVKRRELIEQLKKKELMTLICTSQIGGEGLDIPSLDAIINAGGGKSAIQTIQRSGRVLRPSPGKTEGYIIDFLDNVKYLKTHSNKRKKMYVQTFGAERIVLFKDSI